MASNNDFEHKTLDTMDQNRIQAFTGGANRGFLLSFVFTLGIGAI